MLTTAYFTSTDDNAWIAHLEDGRQITFMADGEPAEALAKVLGSREVAPLTEEIHEDGSYWYSMTYLVK